MASSKGRGIEELSQFAMELIQRLGKEALSFYGRGKSDIKFDDELVTTAELQLTNIFQDQLDARFPGHRVYNNIQENTDYSHEANRYLWIFDPVDGVDNFQTGIPVWGTSLALLENFWPIFSVFYMPATNDIFHARAGQEAFRGKEKITVSTQKDINDESLLLTFSRFHLHYHSRFPGKVRNMGCATAHICYVAMGRADAAIITNESYQGLATARVIIEAAGGKILKMDGSDFFLNEYLDGQKIEDHLLVVAPEIFPLVMNTLQKIS